MKMGRGALAFDDLVNLFSSSSKSSQSKRVFFYRICGTGMGSAATLLKEQGFCVEGGDIEYYPPVSYYLKESGIKCFALSEVKDEYLATFDLIIVGNVVARNSEHAKRIENLGVPYTSFPAALGALVLKDQNVVGIAGTHGKTTTTYFMVQVFEKLGMRPGYLIGGVIPDRNSAELGDGSYFFIESDEYDSGYFHKQSKFHFYCIDHLVLTSLEFDHADIFSSVEAIEKEFIRLMPTIPETIIASSEYSSIKKVMGFAREDVNKIYYGERYPKIVSSGPSGTKFCVRLGDQEQEFATNIVGPQNILNLTSVILFAYSQGYTSEQIASALLDLRMVKRRQEIRGYYHNKLVIDDFAHHPTAVELTIENIKISYPLCKLVVVFAPMSATARSSLFENEFAQSLLKADAAILVVPNKASTVQNTQSIDCKKIATFIEQKGIHSLQAHSLQELRENIDSMVAKFTREETVFLILSNGNILGLWESDFVNELKKQKSET
ncbi:MAG: hypothetical protein HQK50_15725 [Oligoflexia bacterium]|nr:hypothetical protein [Oligoflexia bacterium]MBF0367023.1 hypothetical protein [Oligoflexia bacterium]